MRAHANGCVIPMPRGVDVDVPIELYLRRRRRRFGARLGLAALVGAVLGLLLVMLAGCQSSETWHDNRVIVQPGAIVYHGGPPAPEEGPITRALEGPPERGQVGHGSQIVSISQSSGSDQATDRRSDVAARLAASVTGQGQAGTADAGGDDTEEEPEEEPPPPEAVREELDLLLEPD